MRVINGLHVNTDEVLLLAENVLSLNGNITSALDKVTSTMNTLNGSWSGAAAERAMSKFNSINNGCIDVQKNVVADYANFLKQRVSSGYDHIESTNISLSEAFK